MEALEARVSVPQGNSGSQTQTGTEMNADNPTMDVDVPATHDYVKDPVVYLNCILT